MRKLFKERKLFKGGNYMRKYGIYIPPHLVNKKFSSTEYIVFDRKLLSPCGPRNSLFDPVIH